MFDVTNEIQDIVDSLKSAQRISTDGRIHYLKPRTRWGLCNCGDLRLLLKLFLDMGHIFRIDAPERLKVVIDLVVFIRELDVMFHNVVPPFRPILWANNPLRWNRKRWNSPLLKTKWGRALVTPLVFRNSFIQRLASTLDFRFPIPSCLVDQLEDRMWAVRVYK